MYLPDVCEGAHGAVALAASYGAHQSPSSLDPEACLAALRPHLSDPELLGALSQSELLLKRGGAAREFVEALGLQEGVSGYINHTVPVALFCWLRYREDFRRAVEEAILLGGDTDTVGAIVGALSGAVHGEDGIPKELISGLCEWPRSVSWMRELAARLARQFPEAGEGERSGPVPLFWPGLWLRNLVFWGGVLRYGFRRLFPPY